MCMCVCMYVMCNALGGDFQISDVDVCFTQI